jgi:TrmH family RNA methyltransferase
MRISSGRNPILQEIRRAALSGRMTAQGLIVAEGPHLLEEALRSRWTVEEIVATPEARERHSRLVTRAQAAVTEVSERAFETVATTETTQGVLALLRPRECAWSDLIGRETLLVILDGLQDPGNAGTIVRSAEAFGATGAVFLKGCVRVANGKFLRATAGSILRIPFLEGLTVPDLVASLATENMPLYALSSRGELPITSANLTGACALAVGSEAAGVSDELLRSATPVCIPVHKVESLNAAVACSIALFEAARQRGEAKGASG